MSKIAWNPGTLLAPVPPALVTCGSMQAPNVLTVAWTGIVNSDPAMTYISVRPCRHSYPLIKQSGQFAVNLTTAALVKAADFCGVRSGKTVDKFKECGLTPIPASNISAPILKECPLALECVVKESFLLGSHEMFLAEIVAVDVEEDLIDENGKLHLSAAGLLAYAHGEYFELGKRMGSFGYSVRKKKKFTSPKKK